MAAYRDYLAHEEMRWATMTEAQLLTRLRRITKPQKLEAFMELARWNRKESLLRAASRRAVELGLDYLRGVDDGVVNRVRTNTIVPRRTTSSAPTWLWDGDHRVWHNDVELSLQVKPVVQKNKKQEVRKIRFSRRRSKK